MALSWGRSSHAGLMIALTSAGLVVLAVLLWADRGSERRVLDEVAARLERAQSGGIAEIVGDDRAALRAGFTVEVERVFTDEFGDTRLIGIIRNGNTVAAGAAIKVTSYDADGRLVEVKDGSWPASIRNINPGVSYSFETLASSRPGVARVAVEIVDARTW